MIILGIAVVWFLLFAWRSRKQFSTPKKFAIALGSIVPWLCGLMYLAVVAWRAL